MRTDLIFKKDITRKHIKEGALIEDVTNGALEYYRIEVQRGRKAEDSHMIDFPFALLFLFVSTKPIVFDHGKTSTPATLLHFAEDTDTDALVEEAVKLGIRIEDCDRVQFPESWSKITRGKYDVRDGCLESVLRGDQYVGLPSRKKSPDDTRGDSFYGD